ncbi:MAG: hypothetical protein COV07_04335 [Candidatus Vogelbacteria bacterium CG10_big_fil_rev_8_21_14_0_10_45_14]|uniref:HTH cro/C1-type domain-containing protein n=1 Tax=Candidatus Vogelbacteria bacterium CG10_big_fil_rev_8_21_14_0_10_45_14 TaxID=1975042 RepID=A0A2H0RII3_9BACT|nr:MAG: hypothetical protein COV07_04335 [Candidatus Vogelbacteria bacterium CG10_big_fil_rev_8_21_14_0_10_45_14]
MLAESKNYTIFFDERKCWMKKKHPVGVGMVVCSTPLGEFLRYLRLDRKVTQAEVASSVGIKQTHWSQLEIGRKKNLNSDLCRRIALYFNIPHSQLEYLLPKRKATPQGSLAYLLAKYMKSSNMTISSLALKMDMDAGALARYVNGDRKTASYQTARLFVHVLGFSIEEILPHLTDSRDTPESAVGELIRTSRRRLLMSIQDLAKKLTITRARVSQIELGKVRIGVCVLKKVALAVQISDGDLLKAIETQQESMKTVSPHQ